MENDTFAKCDRCGVYFYELFHLPNHLWRKITENEDYSGQLCISCCDYEAREKDIILWWEAEEDMYPTQRSIFNRRILAQKVFNGLTWLAWRMRALIEPT